MVASIDIGLCGGIDTLVSQAFGRKNYRICGIYLNTSLIVFTGLFLFQAIFLYNSTFFLLLLGQPPEAVEVAQTYINWTLPALYLNMLFQAYWRFLGAQGIYNPVLLILFITTVIHIFSLYLFVIVFDCEIIGAAIAINISYTIGFVLLVLYVHQYSNVVLSEKFFLADKQAYLEIKQFLKYGGPSCSMLIFEWWGFEFLNILAGWVGVEELAAFVIMLQILMMLFMSALGLSLSSVSLVGNSLGRMKTKMTRTYIKASLILGVISTSIIAVLLWILRYRIISIFTSDPKIVQL